MPGRPTGDIVGAGVVLFSPLGVSTSFGFTPRSIRGSVPSTVSFPRLLRVVAGTPFGFLGPCLRVLVCRGGGPCVLSGAPVCGGSKFEVLYFVLVGWNLWSFCHHGRVSGPFRDLRCLRQS